MDQFSKDLIKEITQEVSDLIRSKKFSVPYAIHEVLKGYKFADQSVRDNTFRTIASRLGKRGAAKAKAKKKRKRFESLQTSLHLVA